MYYMSYEFENINDKTNDKDNLTWKQINSILGKENKCHIAALKTKM